MYLFILILILIIILYYFFSYFSFDSAIKLSTNYKNPDSFYKTINLFENNSFDDDPFVKIISYIQLARLYQNGLIDKYDRNGNKIKGIEPDIKKSIDYYNNAIKSGSWLAIYELADLYNFETESKFFNKKKAKELYNFILNNVSNSTLSMNEKSNLLINSKNRLIELDPTYSNYIHFKLDKKIKPKPKPKPRHRTRTRTRNNTQPVIRNNTQPVIGINNDITDPITNQIRNDSQNAHDHVVINSIRNNIKKLESNTIINSDPTTTLINIRNMILQNNNISKDKKDDAILTLDTIESNYFPISYAGLSESEILNLVWNRIQMPDLENNKDNCINNLINELAESVEHGKVTCASGRVNRIIDSLNKIDPLIEIKPKWAINKEMMEKAGKIRSDLENELPDTTKEALNTDDPDEEQLKICETFDTNLKNKLRQEFKKDYVDSGLINQEILNNELNKWINDI